LGAVDRGPLIFEGFDCPEVSLLTKKDHIFLNCKQIFKKLLDNTANNHAFLIDQALCRVVQIPIKLTQD